MTTLLHIGKHRIQTLTASDGSVIPPGTLEVSSETPSMVGVTVDADNKVTITGLATGTTLIHYSAPGYIALSNGATVAPLPTLILTDGPEV